MPIDLAALAPVVERALDRAREETLSRFRSVTTEWKSDGSPVTEADYAAERAMREVLREATPDFGIMGEEYGAEGEEASVRWVLDPIDGTIAYSRGLPTYSSLISLEADGEWLLGAIDLPPVNERTIGWRGGGVRCNGVPVRCSQETDLQKAMVAHGDRMTFDRTSQPGWFDRLAQLPFIRGYTDGFGHALVLRGGVDVMVDLHLNPWDTGPSLAMVEEAGGRIELIDEGAGKFGLVFGAPAMVEAVLALRAD